MSYMRWPVYAWVGGACEDDCPPFGCFKPEHEVMNLWVHEVPDEGVGRAGPSYGVEPNDHYAPELSAGIRMPMPLFDELVVYRLAELLQRGLFDATVARALSALGNSGSYMLQELAGLDLDASIQGALEKARAERDNDRSAS